MAGPAALALTLLVCAFDAFPQEVIEGSGRIEGRFCQHAARLVLDDGRYFEVDLQLARNFTTVEVRDGRVQETLCGQAHRLLANKVAAPARPTVELTFSESEWSSRAKEIDNLSKRFTNARFLFRVTGREADDVAVRIAMQILEQRPDLMARSSVEPGGGASGWRVRIGARSEHAASADDVARMLAAVR